MVSMINGDLRDELKIRKKGLDKLGLEVSEFEVVT